MHEPLAATGAASSSDVAVGDFRQILFCPVQVVPQQVRQDSTHWERLFEVDSSWAEDAGDFTGDAADFDERSYAEFIAFMKAERGRIANVGKQAGIVLD